MAVHCAARYPEACQAMITMSAVTFVEQRTLRHPPGQAWFADPAQRERLRRYHGERSDWVLSAWIDTLAGAGFRHMDAGSTRCLRSAVRALPSMAMMMSRLRTPPAADADHAGGQVEQALLSGWAMFRIESNRDRCWSGSNGSCSGSVISLRA